MTGCAKNLYFKPFLNFPLTQEFNLMPAYPYRCTSNHRDIFSFVCRGTEVRTLTRRTKISCATITPFLYKRIPIFRLYRYASPTFTRLRQAKLGNSLRNIL